MIKQMDIVNKNTEYGYINYALITGKFYNIINIINYVKNFTKNG